MKVEKIEHHTQITGCCEVEPEYGLVDKRCPNCGCLNPRTVDRVTITREVIED